MSDLRDEIRHAADRRRPPDDWFERIHDRARIRRRNRRVLAGVVGLGVPLVLAIAVIVNLGRPDGTRPGVLTPEAPCPVGTGVVPTVWWRADGSSTDAIARHEASLHDDAGFGPGIVGEAFILDGEGDFIEVPDSPSLQVGSDDFTISMWVRFTSTEGEQVLIEDWIETRATEGMKGWTLTKLRNNVIGFGMGSAGGVDTERLDLPIDTWIHVAARRSDGTVSVFVDGELVAGGPMTHPSRPVDSAASLKIGHRGGPDDTPGSLDRRGFFLKGSVDEIALYFGTGLSDGEIRKIFESRSACVV